MLGGFGLTELLVVLAIALLIFGPKRLKSLGSDLGTAIKGFRIAVKEETTEASGAPGIELKGRASKDPVGTPSASERV
jgi:TatA/E family protein of Tat protein translocase